MNYRTVFIFPFLLLASGVALANVYGAVRGVVHDPHHRPIQDAMVMLKSKSSDWSKSTTTNNSGEFQFNGVPLGDYSVTVASKGFAQTGQDVTVISGTVPVVHFQLDVESVRKSLRFRLSEPWLRLTLRRRLRSSTARTSSALPERIKPIACP